MAKKYTNLGAYTKPTQEEKAFAEEKGWSVPTKAYVKVNLPVGVESVTIKNGDKILITKKEDKLQQIQANKNAMSEKAYKFLTELYSSDDTIGEMTLTQKE